MIMIMWHYMHNRLEADNDEDDDDDDDNDDNDDDDPDDAFQ